MVKRISPFLTNWRSSKCTASTTPETWGRISTRSIAWTRPEKSSHSVTDCSKTGATETATGGGAALAADGLEAGFVIETAPVAHKTRAPAKRAIDVRVMSGVEVFFI